MVAIRKFVTPAACAADGTGAATATSSAQCEQADPPHDAISGVGLPLVFIEDI